MSRKNLVLIVLAVLALGLIGVVVALQIGLGSEPDAEPATGLTSAPPTTVPEPTTTVTTVTTTTSTTVSSGGSFVFAATADTTIDSAVPDISRGAEPFLEIESDEPGDIRRALMRFLPSGLPEGMEVSRVSLRLELIDGSQVEGVVSSVDGDWDENVTWSGAPALGPAVASIPVMAEGSIIEIDVTPLFSPNASLDIYLLIESDDDMAFASREAGASGPVVVVTVGEESVSEGPAVLVGAGDIASCDGDGDELTAGLVRDYVDSSDPVVVFTAGDSTYETGSEESYAQCYDPSWGVFKELTRPAPGSRDYLVRDASGYFGYFGDRAGDPDRGYYSYTHGPWLVMVLNSNCGEIGGCDEGSPQHQWLLERLRSSRTFCSLAIWQRPGFSSTVSGGVGAVAPIFEALFEGGVDVAITGNEHFYERFAPQDPSGDFDDSGIRQFIVGTGGRSLDEFGPTAANSEFRYNAGYGVLAMTLNDGSYEWAFVGEGREPIDTGTGACH